MQSSIGPVHSPNNAWLFQVLFKIHAGAWEKCDCLGGLTTSYTVTFSTGYTRLSIAAVQLCTMALPRFSDKNSHP